MGRGRAQWIELHPDREISTELRKKARDSPVWPFDLQRVHRSWMALRFRMALIEDYRGSFSVGSLTKYFPMRGMTDPTKAAAIASGVIKVN